MVWALIKEQHVSEAQQVLYQTKTHSPEHLVNLTECYECFEERMSNNTMEKRQQIRALLVSGRDEGGSSKLTKFETNNKRNKTKQNK